VQVLGQLWSSGFSLMKAGWRLWPLAHVITYGLVPAEHRCPRTAYCSVVYPLSLGKPLSILVRAGRCDLCCLELA
jgi:Mpv17 / PMP22 family